MVSLKPLGSVLHALNLAREKEMGCSSSRYQQCLCLLGTLHPFATNSASAWLGVFCDIDDGGGGDDDGKDNSNNPMKISLAPFYR